jgi:hypothetical protein
MLDSRPERPVLGQPSLDTKEAGYLT